MAKKVTLLGSTGSIGTQSLDVIRTEGFEVSGLAAHTQADLLLKQVEEFQPAMVAVTDESAADKVQAAFAHMASAPRLLRSAEGLRTLAAESGADVVLNAVVGAAGLPATLAALESGCDVALANKESLVTGGALVLEAAEKHHAKLLPVDSEHSAIFQCLQDAYSAKSLQKILLTASGGPFFGKTREELLHVKKEDALRHPNWSMGAKITIDSATLMNKGLELIEAVWLFGLAPRQVEIVVQRQSIIHSMVQFSDHSILAQLGCPDMRVAIQYALTYPDRLDCPAPALDLTAAGALEFTEPDYFDSVLKKNLPPVSPIKEELVDRIANILIGCEQEFVRRYPGLGSKSRPVVGTGGGDVSFHVYTIGELKTYSERTLSLMSSYLSGLDTSSELENPSFVIHAATVGFYGYESLDSAEAAIVRS